MIGTVGASFRVGTTALFGAAFAIRTSTVGRGASTLRCGTTLSFWASAILVRTAEAAIARAPAFRTVCLGAAEVVAVIVFRATKLGAARSVLGARAMAHLGAGGATLIASIGEGRAMWASVSLALTITTGFESRSLRSTGT